MGTGAKYWVIAPDGQRHGVARRAPTRMNIGRADGGTFRGRFVRNKKYIPRNNRTRAWERNERPGKIPNEEWGSARMIPHYQSTYYEPKANEFPWPLHGQGEDMN